MSALESPESKISESSVCISGNCTAVAERDDPAGGQRLALCIRGETKLKVGIGSDREGAYGVPRGIDKFLRGVWVEIDGTYGGVTSRRATISQSLFSH